jgi:peptide/nickel transport system substrate-binding protein
MTRSLAEEVGKPRGEATGMKRCTALVLLLALAAAGCSQRSAAPARGGNVLRVALPQEPKTLNPLLVTSTIDGFVARLMFEPLISADAKGRPYPILAAQVPSTENGGVSADGRTITYYLRPQVQWSDGVPVSSADVKFSWSAIMNPANNVVTRHGYDDVASIDTPNALTLVVHLKRAFAPFVNTFFAESDQPYNIAPAHVLAKEPEINKLGFNQAPTVSDGPFTFVRWNHGDRIVLAANPKFMFGRPKLDGMDVLTVANENTSVNMLRTGAIDYMFQASIVTYPQLKGASSIHVIMNPVNGYEGMGFNLLRKPMSDPRFRLAVAYAVDKQRLVDDLTYGQVKIANGDLPDWMWANNPAIKPLPHDVAKAKALLAQASVKTPLSLVLVTDSANVTHKRAAVLLQAMLHDVGIDLEIKTYPGDLLYATRAAGGIMNSQNYDLSLNPWYGGLDPDNSSEFSCENRSPNGWNMEMYCSAQMDALQQRALTHYDLPTRASAYHAIEALIAKDNPLIFFWWQRQQEPISNRFHGFAPNPVTESWNAWEWRLSS